MTPEQEERLARLERKVAALEKWAQGAGTILKDAKAYLARQKLASGLHDLADKLGDLNNFRSKP